MKLNLTILTLFLTVAILSSYVAATGFEKFDIESTILDDQTVKYRIEMIFDEPLIRLNYPFNFRILNLTTSNDFGTANCKLVPRGRLTDIECEFSGMTESKKTVTLDFYTAEEIISQEEKRRYASNYFVKLPINKTSVLLRLPDRGTLSEQPTNSSYYPGDGLVRTDGRYIMVYWERGSVGPGDTLTFSASYVITGSEFLLFYNTLAILVIILIIIFAGITWFLFKHRTVKKSKEVLVSVLDKDEKTVYDILLVHGGSANQKVIVRESNFSKAKISRIVRRLVNRNIVSIEPISGRENKIVLKEKQKQQNQQPAPIQENKPEQQAQDKIE